MKNVLNKMMTLTCTLMIFSSCNDGAKTAEGLVEMYVKDVTSSSVDRDYFEKYTSGKMLESIKNLSDEEFAKFIDLKKIKNAKVNIVTKTCESLKCTITYIVKYDVFDQNKKAFESEVKKIAKVQKFEEIWKILDVTNIKTYHESTTPIDAMVD